MKKLFLTILLGFGLITMLMPVQNVKAIATESDEAAPVKTIIVGGDEVGNSNRVRVYQKVDQRMNITNRTLSNVANHYLKHWYGQYIQFAGQHWWKVGENQYLKPNSVSIVNVERMQELGHTVSNYGNFNNKNGVSLINEE